MPGRHQPGDSNRGLRQRTNSLSEEERRLLRAALKGLRHRYGSWAAVAQAMGVSVNTLWGVAKGKDFGSMKLAELAAKAAGVRVEVLLSGVIISADRCPACGQAWRRG